MESIFKSDFLEGQNVLITGASSGIGKEIAIRCSHHGAQVWLLARNQERLQETNGLCNPNSAVNIICDLTQQNEIDDFVNSIKPEIIFNHIINAAGATATLPLKFTSAKKINEILASNVVGPISLTQLLLKNRKIKVNGGCILFIASVMSSVGESGKTLYGLSKGAITAAVKSMAVELASKGIRVNSISPGVVETPLSGSSPYSKDPEALQHVTYLHPLGLGKVEDVANTCLYLISDASSWITGVDLKVDGGYTAR